MKEKKRSYADGEGRGGTRRHQKVNKMYQSRNNKLGEAEEPLRAVTFRAETQVVSYHDSWCGPSR